MAKILITGGTGLIGGYLIKELSEKGHAIRLFSRNPDKSTLFPTFFWDIKNNQIDEKAFEGIDTIIHLAGANIGASKWTIDRKQEIIASRVYSANLLFRKCKELNIKLKAFISASGIAFYGNNPTTHTFVEGDPAGNDFLAEVAKKWEAAANKFNELGARVVTLRTAIVLAKEAEALSKMVTPIKLGIGAPLGRGKQYMPWIHINDLVNMYPLAIERENINGNYNAVAPSHINNTAFMKTIASALNKPFFMPNVPTFVLRAALGEMADLVLKGNKVAPKRFVEEEHFQFEFVDLKSALESVL